MTAEMLQRWIHDPTFGRLATAVILLTAILIASRVLQRAASRRLSAGSGAHRVRKVIAIVGYVVAMLVLLATYSDRLTGLGVTLGVAGAGIAFALQEVIASVAGWVAIAFGRFYSTGDRVQLGGIKGDVIDIGILRTTLMEIGQWVDGDQYNGRIVRIANAFIFKEPVFNYSADFAFLWDEVKVPIRYGSDWKYTGQVLQHTLEEVCGEFARQSAAAWTRARDRYALEDANIAPQVTLVANDNWIEFTARYVVDYRRRRSTKDAIFRRFLTAVDQSDDKIRLASATFELVNFPRVDVTLKPGQAMAVPRYVP